MIELFPDGFEEVDRHGALELAAYTDASGEERLWHTFGAASGADVEEGWDERWRAFHRPVEIGGLWVGPPWEGPPAGLVPIVIEPGQAFGTGGHPTTRLCLALLQELPRGSVLDVGCGSGVLSIAAAKLGYAPVLGVDVEPQAVAATEENARANGVRVAARLVEAAAGPLPPADLALANISFHALAAVVPRLSSARLLASGYLVADEPLLEGYRHVDRRTDGAWAADVFERI